MKSINAFCTILCAALVHSGCGATNPSLGPPPGVSLEQLVGRMPPRDSVEGSLVYSLLAHMGPDAVAELTERLVPPGTETCARAEYALGGLAVYVTAPGRESERSAYVAALARLLQGPIAPRQSAFLLGRLQIAGRSESVGVLSRFLNDERLCEPAAAALVAIRDGAEPALLAALPESRGNSRLTIIKSLGDLRIRAAVDALTAEALSDDIQIRNAALHALSNIGDPRTADLIAKAAAKSPQESRRELTSCYVLLAQREAASGDRSGALAIGEMLYGSRNVPDEPQVRTAGLSLIVEAKGENAIDDLTSAASDSSRELRSAALRLAGRIPGESSTRKWIAALDRPDTRRDVIAMLGSRGDVSAYPALLSALGDKSPEVRSAAIQAAVRLKGATAVAPLMSHLERIHEAADIRAVRQTLEVLPADSVVPYVVPSLTRVTPPSCVMLIEYLGKVRHVPSAPILALARSADPSVRLAALKALGAVGRETDRGEMTRLMLEAENETERAAAQKSLVAVCSRSVDPERRAETALSAYREATPAQRMSLLRVIGSLGSRSALALAGGELRSRDPELRDAAIRALASWPSLDAFDTLLAVARSSESLNLRVIALRGAVRMVENAHVTAATAARYHARTLAAAERPEEKRLVLGALANLGSGDALDLVIPYIRSDSLGLDAATAALSIASGMTVEKDAAATPAVTKAFIGAMIPPRFKSRIDHRFDAAGVQSEPPEGFSPLFNGRDLQGWKGLVENPIVRRGMKPEQLAAAQVRADSSMRAHWSASDGVLTFDGKGESLCTSKDYTDFEMLVDWKIEKNGDSGIYLRGSPQVQIWDPSQWPEGSGGLYNNQKNPSRPRVCADNAVGEWNRFRILMIGERVTVWLNGVMVVDSVVLENYWDRSLPIFPSGQIELQSHNSPLYFRNIFIRELTPHRPLFSGRLFNGNDLAGWKIIGGKEGNWGADNGVLYTSGEGGGWLSTDREFDNFELDLDFRVPEGGNSGVFLRAPREGDPAYTGMEIQILDDYASEYAKLQPWQYCGSIYGVQAPAVRASRKAHEWQHYHIVAKGPSVSVTLNGRLIVDADLTSHMDKEATHPGLKRRSGFIGLQSHTLRVEFRNITVKEIEWNEHHD
jgi:HEAT repeat protein